MYEICEECGHSMSMHIGVISMGGGHSEALGCTHNVPGGLCDCVNYDKEMDYSEYDDTGIDPEDTDLL